MMVCGIFVLSQKRKEDTELPPIFRQMKEKLQKKGPLMIYGELDKIKASSIQLNTRNRCYTPTLAKSSGKPRLTCARSCCIRL